MFNVGDFVYCNWGFNGGCLLGYEQIYDSIKDFYIPKECYHKLKTIKEFSKRFKNK